MKPETSLLTKVYDRAKEYNKKISRNVSVALSPSSVKAYWWDDKPNFGDYYTPLILRSRSQKKIVNVRGAQLDLGPALVGAGSVLQGLKYPNTVVWGSGFISSQPLKKLPVQPKAILALRGPKSAEVAANLGWSKPEVYGDPGLLASRIIPKEPRRWHIGIVAHYSHEPLFASLRLPEGCTLIRASSPAAEVIKQISACDVVLSSSLHGLITAHSYGLPWCWLNFSQSRLAGGDFKFDDFFESLDLSTAPYDLPNDGISVADIEKAYKLATSPSGKSVKTVTDDLFSSLDHALTIVANK